MGVRPRVPAWAARGLPELQAGVGCQAACSFTSLSKAVHLLAAPCDPHSWPGLAGLFGMAGSESPGRLSATLASPPTS